MNVFSRASAVALAALALTGLTGCGGSHRAASKATGPAATDSASSSPDTIASDPATPSPSRTRPVTVPLQPTVPRRRIARRRLAVAAIRGCRTGQLKADLIFQSARDGRVNSMLALTNKSATLCGVKGSVTVTVFNAAGKPATSLTIPKDFPGPGQLISLKHGVTAFSGVQWKAGPGCDVASTIGGAPNEDGVAKANPQSFGNAAETAARWRICGGKVTVGTLQPASQGVNFT
jgi:hypothetical protein